MNGVWLGTGMGSVHGRTPPTSSVRTARRRPPMESTISDQFVTRFGASLLCPLSIDDFQFYDIPRQTRAVGDARRGVLEVLGRVAAFGGGEQPVGIDPQGDCTPEQEEPVEPRPFLARKVRRQGSELPWSHFDETQHLVYCEPAVLPAGFSQD